MVEFLLFEPTFPRSLLYCLRAAADLVKRIWAPGESVGRASIARLDALVAWLEAQIDDFDPSHIHTVLTRVVDDTAMVCAHIARKINGPPTAEEIEAEAERLAKAPPAASDGGAKTGQNHRAGSGLTALLQARSAAIPTSRHRCS